MASRFWNPARLERQPEGFWMAHPTVRRYINRAVTGDEGTWPLETFKARRGETSFERVLVPGCGTGELERDLLAKGLCQRVDAFDVSASAVGAARERAIEAGLGDRIRYSVTSFEAFSSPAGTYDACFFHHSLHHLSSPERALERVRQWLEPGGILYLDEYVGPSRSQWNRRSFEVACEIYRHVPRSLRKSDRLAIPGLLAKLSDPSESTASDRILAAVVSRFDVLERHDYGGFLLQPLWDQVTHEPDLVGRLVATERALAPHHPTWFVVLTGQRRG